MIAINLLVDGQRHYESNTVHAMLYKVCAKEFDSLEDREDDYAILSVYVKRRSQWLHTIIHPVRKKLTCGNASS